MFCTKILLKQCLAMGSPTLRTTIKSSEGFLDTLIHKLSASLRHSFTISQPSTFLNQLRTAPSESVVLQDFAKNYHITSKMKLENQYNNSQATFRYFAIHFKGCTSAVFTHDNFDCNCLKYNTLAVQLF